MRVLVFGGTRFIGRAIVEELIRGGNEVAVLHRGQTEPKDFVQVQHVHADRANLSEVGSEIRSFDPQAMVDCLAMTRTGALQSINAVSKEAHIVVLSSCDVYRAYTGVMGNHVVAAVPLYENSEVREIKYPYKDMPNGPAWMTEYEKLDVEEEFLKRNGVVIRLPMVYGEFDGQRREEFILRRVRAGRRKIPVGAGTWLASRGYVRDMASGVAAAIMNSATQGEIFNLAESRTRSIGLWAREILEAAGHDAELVRVPDHKIPEDLKMTGDLQQHLLIDSSKARRMLDWVDGDASLNLKRSVEWHLAHPPQESSEDFAEDDLALA